MLHSKINFIQSSYLLIYKVLSNLSTKNTHGNDPTWSLFIGVFTGGLCSECSVVPLVSCSTQLFYLSFLSIHTKLCEKGNKYSTKYFSRLNIHDSGNYCIRKYD